MLELEVDCLILMPEAANIKIIYESPANIQAFVLDLIGLQIML